jgi:hypothetical protein
LHFFVVQGFKKERVLVQQKPLSKGGGNKVQVFWEHGWNNVGQGYEATTPKRWGEKVGNDATQPTF